LAHPEHAFAERQCKCQRTEKAAQKKPVSWAWLGGVDFSLLIATLNFMRIPSLLTLTLATGLLVIGSENRPTPTTGLSSVESKPRAAIFHPDEGHLWNQLHAALFVRVDQAGKEYGSDAVDPLLWPSTSFFLLQGKSHDKAIGLLDQFIDKGGAKLIEDPVKRAVMQHDLWAVFDWTANTFNPLPFGGKVDHRKYGTSKLTNARKALRQRLAKAITSLSLNKKEIASLPNNYEWAIKDKSFHTRFEEKNPQQSMLPADLLKPNGPWVCVRGALNGPSAPVHMQYYRGRSPFLVFIKLPEGRSATLNYLNRLNKHSSKALQSEDWDKNLPLFPEGTAVALVRQMTVIDQAGKMVPTSLVQSVQLRVYRKVGQEITDHKTSQAVFKFTLNRRDLFAKKTGGLKPVSFNKRTGLSLVSNEDYFESDRHTSRDTVMQSCINCHSCGGATAKSIFSFKQDDWVRAAHSFASNSLRLSPTDINLEQKRAIRWKSQRHDWGLLQGWLETQVP
jgi:hypothetical protein